MDLSVAIVDATHLSVGVLQVGYVLTNTGDEELPAGTVVEVQVWDESLTTMIASQQHAYEHSLHPGPTAHHSIHVETDPGEVVVFVVVNGPESQFTSDGRACTVPDYPGSRHHEMVVSDADFFLEVQIIRIEAGSGGLRAFYRLSNTGTAPAPAGTLMLISAVERTSLLLATQEHPLTEVIHAGTPGRERYLSLVVDPGTWDVTITAADGETQGNSDTGVVVQPDAFSLEAGEG